MLEENDEVATGKLLDQLLLGSNLVGPRILTPEELRQSAQAPPNLNKEEVFELIINTFGIQHVDTETNTLMGDPLILENSEVMSKPKRSFSEQ